MLNGFSKRQPFLFSTTASQWIVGLLSAAILFLIVHFVEPAPQHIATVDITRIVNQFVQSQAQLHLPAKLLHQRVNAFGHQLQVTLNQIAQKHHAVLLVQEAVVAGAKTEDLTPLVEQQLLHLASQ